MVKFIALFMSLSIFTGSITSIYGSEFLSTAEKVYSGKMLKDNAPLIVLFTVKNTELTETKVKILAQFWQFVENI